MYLFYMELKGGVGGVAHLSHHPSPPRPYVVLTFLG